MKLRLLLRRLTISAPNLSVRAQLPWPLRAAAFVLLLALGGAAAIFIYDAGRRFTGWDPTNSRDEIARLRQSMTELSLEKDTLQANANSAESRVAIERTAKEQLAMQVKQLESDNAQLKDDLAFFEGLLPNQNAKENSGVYIRTAKVIRAGEKDLRYRILVMQSGRNVPQFEGMLRLVVTYAVSGKSSTITYPENGSNESSKPFLINLKHYQRLEGLVTLPSGAQAKSVQIRVEDRNGIRTQQLINL